MCHVGLYHLASFSLERQLPDKWPSSYHQLHQLNAYSPSKANRTCLANKEHQSKKTKIAALHSLNNGLDCLSYYRSGPFHPTSLCWEKKKKKKLYRGLLATSGSKKTFQEPAKRKDTAQLLLLFGHFLSRGSIRLASIPRPTTKVVELKLNTKSNTFLKVAILIICPGVGIYSR